MTDMPSGRRPWKYADRPAPCPACDSPAWWTGGRVVSQTRLTERGAEHATGIRRRRARCSSSSCPAKGWTIYEDGGYPHRSFQLDVVADAVVNAEIGSGSLTAAGAAVGASRDSVRRWVGWVEDLAEPGELEALIVRLDGDAMRASSPSIAASRVATIVVMLERLADVLAIGGVPIARRGSGLLRILTVRFSRFREVFLLTRVSPPLRADLLEVGV